MINYWLSQSKSIRKDLFNLFRGSYFITWRLWQMDLLRCWLWPKGQQCCKWRLKWAHELLKLVCYGNGHCPLKTCLQPGTHMAAAVMLMGLGVKANNKPLLPSPQASTEAAASTGKPTAAWSVWRISNVDSWRAKLRRLNIYYKVGNTFPDPRNGVKIIEPEVEGALEII